MVRPATTVVSVLALASSAVVITGHPLCYYGPDRAVSTEPGSKFCPNELAEGFCCNASEELALADKYTTAGVSAACAPLYKEVLCGVCNPYSAHLYTRLGSVYPQEDNQEEHGLAMTHEFCGDFVTACGEDLSLPATYCGEHVLASATREYWSYPLDISASFSDTDVNPTFPELGESNLPTEPVDMHMTPDGTAWWIAGMAGEIIQVKLATPGTAVTVLDISGKILYAFEQGLLGFTFSPSFSTSGLFYVSYSIPGGEISENGKNVLSKFIYSPDDVETTIESEEVLITTSDKTSSAHSSGWVGFPPSAYADELATYHDLYWSVGDGGPQNDPFNNAQDLTILHGTIVRISVPSSATGSSYEIPVGNAFDGSNGEATEICAWGFRNPFRCSFDSETDDLYCGDVGQDSVEEVNLIQCGKNYGWRNFEGSSCHEEFEGATDCTDLNRTDYTFPTFQYCHFDYDSGSEEFDSCGDRRVTGLSVIGGYIYRGTKFADVLGGHYIFADYSTGVLHHLAPAVGGGWTAGTILTSAPQVASFAEDQDGELYMIGYKGDIYDLPCGSLCAGDAMATCMPQSENMTTFEEIGCFIDDHPRAMPLALDVPECETMNAQMCARFCATVEGATHFGLQYQRECFCSGEDDDYAVYGKTDDAECNMPCSGFPDEMCGGHLRLNVFNITGEGSPETPLVPTQQTTLATPISSNYLGCYADFWDPRMLASAFASRPSEAMTVRKCKAFCLVRGSSLFALENGKECWCGENYHAQKANDELCNTPCSGDPESRCGGFLHRDIYRV